MPERIPSRETCFALMEQYGMLSNIKDHSLQVARIAVCLGENLLPKFPDLNLDLVEAGGLLHDIAKTECLKTKGNHALVGETMVREWGYEAVARIVGQHVVLEGAYFQSEKMDEIILVHYADKRVRHDEIVGLDDRFTYLVDTYGRSPEAVERIQALYQDTLKVEGMIFQHLPFPPQSLIEYLQ
ncbi:MAG: HD domain-containing protein [Thermodesulfobacteriota bacterium]